jgi:thymidine kinase
MFNWVYSSKKKNNREDSENISDSYEILEPPEIDKDLVLKLKYKEYKPNCLPDNLKNELKKSHRKIMDIKFFKIQFNYKLIKVHSELLDKKKEDKKISPSLCLEILKECEERQIIRTNKEARKKFIPFFESNLIDECLRRTKKKILILKLNNEIFEYFDNDKIIIGLEEKRKNNILKEVEEIKEKKIVSTYLYLRESLDWDSSDSFDSEEENENKRTNYEGITLYDEAYEKIKKNKNNDFDWNELVSNQNFPNEFNFSDSFNNQIELEEIVIDGNNESDDEIKDPIRASFDLSEYFEHTSNFIFHSSISSPPSFDNEDDVKKPFIGRGSIENFPPFSEENCEDKCIISNEEKVEKVVKDSSIDNKMNENIKREYPEGFLEIFLGPMFSGKSTKTLFKLSSMADQRFRCLYVNSYKDERETESKDKFVTTHNSSYSKLSPKIDCVKVKSLSEVNFSNYDYIGIDEFQFFETQNDVNCVIDWVTIYGKYVIVASLDGDFRRQKFGNVYDLIPNADEITKTLAYCDMCRDNYKKLSKAPFTARMTSDTTAELVGGKDIYKAMCRSCHDFHLDVIYQMSETI